MLLGMLLWLIAFVFAMSVAWLLWNVGRET